MIEAEPRRSRRVVGVMHPAVRPADGWDFLLVTLSAMILLEVWRVHQLYPMLAQARVVPIATMATYLAYFLDRDPRRRLRTLNHPLVKIMVAIFGLMVLSVPTSLYPGDSFRLVIDSHPRRFAFVLILAASIRTTADLRRLGAVYLVGAIVYFLTIFTGFGPLWGPAWGGIFYDNNDYAMLAACALPLAAFFATRRGTPNRLLGAGVAALLVLAVAVSGSRTGFLGLVTWCLYVVFRNTAMPRWLRFGGVAVAALGFVAAANEAYKGELSALLRLEQDYNWSGRSPGGRMEIWRRGIGYIVDRPLLGMGVGQFATAEGTRSAEARERREMGQGWKWSAAHNSYIQIGAELGVGGLVLFLVLPVIAVRALRRLVQRERRAGRPRGDLAAFAHAFQGVLWVFAVTAFFLSHAYSTFYYTMLAMAVGLTRGTAPARRRIPAGRPSSAAAAVPAVGAPSAVGRRRS